MDALEDSLAGVPVMLLLTYRVGYAPGFGTRSFEEFMADCRAARSPEALRGIRALP